jgi:peptidoglycan/LPS O-acetylase OafA/YrhL
VLRAVLAILGTPVYVIYKITPAHWDGLALGALLACLPALPSLEQWFCSSIKTLVLVSAICLGALFAYNGFGLYCFSPLCLALGLPFVGILALGLVFSALQAKGGPLHRLLNAYPLQWLGRYSYSIYLIHYPFLCISNWLIGDRKSFLVNLLIAVGVYFVTPLLLARLAWSAIEQPFMSLKSRFKPVFVATPGRKANWM